MSVVRIGLVAALALGLAGCFTVGRGTVPRSGETHFAFCNDGWYFLNCVPFTGNASANPKFPFVCFRDDVKAEKLHARLLAAAAKEGKTVGNIQWDAYEDVMLNVPLTYFTIPIPYLLVYRRIQVSGVAK